MNDININIIYYVTNNYYNIIILCLVDLFTSSNLNPFKTYWISNQSCTTTKVIIGIKYIGLLLVFFEKKI